MPRPPEEVCEYEDGVFDVPDLKLRVKPEPKELEVLVLESLAWALYITFGLKLVFPTLCSEQRSVGGAGSGLRAGCGLFGLPANDCVSVHSCGFMFCSSVIL